MALADDFFVIVLPLRKLATACTTPAMRGGRTIAHVIDLSTGDARSPSRDPVDLLVEADFNRDDSVNATPESFEHRIKRDGLRHRTRITVENRARRGIRAAQSMLNQLKHELVRN
jgi:hypothetical protein